MNPYFDSKEEVLTALESDEAQGLRSEQVKEAGAIRAQSVGGKKEENQLAAFCRSIQGHDDYYSIDCGCGFVWYRNGRRRCCGVL